MKLNPQPPLIIVPGIQFFPHRLDVINYAMTRQIYEHAQRLKIFDDLRIKWQFQYQAQLLQERKLNNIMLSQLRTNAEIFVKTEPYPQESCVMTPLTTHSTLKKFSTELQISPRNEFSSCTKNEPLSEPVNVGEVTSNKNLYDYFQSANKLLTAESLDKDNLKLQITNMVQFFIHNYGKLSQNDLHLQRMKFSDWSYFLELFDTLNQKFSASAKSREDMVRLLIRKALTFMRNSLREELNLSSKKASLALCKKFFLKNSGQELNQNELEEEEIEDKILGFFLPYKKDSRNKTPNARFIEEAFLSENFFKAYIKYLTKFDEIMEADNEKKTKRFVDFIYDCFIKKTLPKIKQYKRLPWVDTWIATTKVVAHELLDANTTKKQVKKLGHHVEKQI